MAELSQKERLQPSLLDRLTDEEPENRLETRDVRVLNVQRLRESVIRDLGWLLNTAYLEATTSLEAYPELKSSTLNYGMPDLTGQTSSNINTAALEKLIRKAIWDFEPRILKKSVKVKIQVNADQHNQNALTFAIDGELWALPVPVRLFLRTELDLETGNVAISESTS